MIFSDEEYIEHYGTPRRSGRYPWGSGGNGYQDNKDFLAYYESLKKQNLTELEIAKGLGLENTTQLRAKKALAINAVKAADIAMVERLAEKQMSNVAIAERLGISEGTVRNYRKPGAKEKNDILVSTANMLKEQIEQKDYINVGAGTELHLGITDTKLRTAVAMLEEQGYKKYYLKIPQLGTKEETTLKVLAKPGTEYSEVAKNKYKIEQPFSYSEDGGRTYFVPLPPMSIDSKRIGIRYAEDGGTEADGVIYVRPGVPDVSIGKSRYAQVRVAVDGTHYLKGMAVYKDDLPPGVDLVFNTNKSNTGKKHDAMKPMSDDPLNPFGASIKRQLIVKDKDGNDKLTSSMNILREEGDWNKWSRSLSSQVLSKQSPKLAKQQLDKTFQNRLDEFNEIKSLTNPAVKQRLLESFAKNTDSASVHLQAAALPRQAMQVIMPIPKMKETEVYAPNYHNGETVALIRFPHAGTFEIPTLTVNNNQPDAKKLLGQAADAIGINAKVAERLSGADFDGDFVAVIPNNNGAIKTSPALEGLKNFDPKKAYPPYEGMKPMSKHTKQNQMGVVSNLISDMTIQGASPEELARAVRHSMVVIDAEKHNLNYKQSYIDNGIPALKARYQSGGASTLITRAGSEKRVARRIERRASKGGPIDPKTGEKVYETTAKMYVNKQGKLVEEKTLTTRLAETRDAHTLSSGTPIERIYADHSNRLKALANTARKEYLATPESKYSDSANRQYKEQVTRLDAALRVAKRNAPLERQAQIFGNAALAEKIRANPSLKEDKDELNKVKAQELAKARTRVGAKKQLIDISDKEWEAIQSGAIRHAKMKEILRYADLDKVKELATPRTKTLMQPNDLQRAKALTKSGHTQAEIAKQLGVSLTTLKNAFDAE